jgi:hypothetical protein
LNTLLESVSQKKEGIIYKHIMKTNIDFDL